MALLLPAATHRLAALQQGPPEPQPVLRVHGSEETIGEHASVGLLPALDMDLGQPPDVPGAGPPDRQPGSHGGQPASAFHRKCWLRACSAAACRLSEAPAWPPSKASWNH